VLAAQRLFFFLFLFFFPVPGFAILCRLCFFDESAGSPNLEDH
jgi:hypothetical protein